MLSFASVYTTGTTTRVSTVELARPPITTVASSALSMPPSSSTNAASGSSAMLVVIAVHEYRPQPHSPALYQRVVHAQTPLTQLLDERDQHDRIGDTIPISISMPIIAGRPSDRPVIASAASAPMIASGRLVMITNGFLSEPRLATITR